MALSSILTGLLACGLVASALAYAELHAWRGWAAVGLYAAAGLIAAELVAAPALWEIFGMPAGWLESLAMALALAVSLHRVCKIVSGGHDEPLRSTEQLHAGIDRGDR